MLVQVLGIQIEEWDWLIFDIAANLFLTNYGDRTRFMINRHTLTVLLIATNITKHEHPVAATYSKCMMFNGYMQCIFCEIIQYSL